MCLIGIAIVSILLLNSNKSYCQVGSAIGASSLQLNVSSGGGGTVTGGSCTNQLVSAIAADTAIPTCSSVNIGTMAVQGALNHTGARAATTYIANGSTAQALDIYGAVGSASDSAYLISLIPTAGAGGRSMIKAIRGDSLGSTSLGLESDGGQVCLGPTGADFFCTQASSRFTNTRSDGGYGFSNTVSGPGIDTVTVALQYSAAGYLKITDASTGGGGLDMKEVTAPSAPAADMARFFVQDDGGGKTQACVIFSSGSAQCFATQP